MGTSFPVALRTLYADGGIPRFYRGVLPALVQGPLSRFGDTAANTGMLTFMDSFESTQNLNVGFKTVAASVAAALFRIFLMPIDTVKTTMRTLLYLSVIFCIQYYLILLILLRHDTEVTGKFSSVVEKMKVGGPMILYNGSIAAASATFVGHYPYVLNVISKLCEHF